MNQPLVEITGLARRYGPVAALDGIDLQVPAGEWLAIMGASGSGKTTLLNVIGLLDRPTAGTYRLDGVDTADLNEAQRNIVRREKVGLVFQQFHLVPHLTAVENVMLAQHFHSVADRTEARQALDRVGVSHRANHLPSQLSGGEQQRVCIARALINDPKVILTDEPTANLDEANEQIVFDIFRELHRQGKTLVIATHDPDLGKLAQRTIWLRHGRLISGADTNTTSPSSGMPEASMLRL